MTVLWLTYRSSMQNARHTEVETLRHELARRQTSHADHSQSPAKPPLGCRLGASRCALPRRGHRGAQARSPSGTDLCSAGRLANRGGVSFRATLKRHDLTGRGVESDPDPAEGFTYARDKAQVIDKVTVGRRKWPPLSHLYQGT